MVLLPKQVHLQKDGGAGRVSKGDGWWKSQESREGVQAARDMERKLRKVTRTRR